MYVCIHIPLFVYQHISHATHSLWSPDEYEARRSLFQRHQHFIRNIEAQLREWMSGTGPDTEVFKKRRLLILFTLVQKRDIGPRQMHALLYQYSKLCCLTSRKCFDSGFYTRPSTCCNRSSSLTRTTTIFACG